MSTQTITNEVKNKVSNKVSEEMRLQIIAQYEAQKLAEAEAAKIEAQRIEAEAAEVLRIEAEAEAAKIAEAKKAEAKRIRDGKKDVDNSILDIILKPSELLKHIDTKYGLNRNIEPSIWIEKLASLNIVKTAQKDSINTLQLEQLIKSLALTLAQMSNDDLEKFSADDKKLMPSKYFSLVINGACKSAKSFKNSQDKLTAFQAKK